MRISDWSSDVCSSDLAVVDLDQIAVAAGAPRALDVAVCGRSARRADRAGNIDAGVHRRAAAEGIAAHPEGAGIAKIGAERVDRGDRDHAMFERIELLPRHEQRPELRGRSRLGGRGLAVDRLVRPAHALGLGGEALRIEAELAELGGGRRVAQLGDLLRPRSEEHTSELQSLMRNSYAFF